MGMVYRIMKSKRSFLTQNQDNSCELEPKIVLSMDMIRICICTLPLKFRKC